MRSFCSGYPGSIILGHGHITLPAYREGLTYRVFSAEQGKSVSLPYWGSEAVRRIDGDADSGTEKKRMLPPVIGRIEVAARQSGKRDFPGKPSFSMTERSHL